MIQRRFVIVVLGFLFPCLGFSQGKENPAIKVLARARGTTEVMLRWAPTTPVAWQLGNQQGYLIERFTVKKNGVADTVAPERILLTQVPIRPKPVEAWETYAQQEKLAAIAVQALYGESFELSDPGQGAMQFMNEASQQENRFGFALLAADMDAKTSELLGLRFTDHLVKSNEEYVYRISLAQQSADYPVESGSVYVNPKEILELPAPKEVEASFSDQSVKLSWSTQYLQRIYVSYKVERSADGGRTFQATDDLNLIGFEKGADQKLYYLDSLPKNGVEYQYRIKGITPFGETGPASKVVSGKGMLSIQGIIAEIDSATLLADGAAYIHWKFPKEYKDRISGYIVAKASHAAGPYADLTAKPIQSLSFVDKNPGAINYYIVKVVGLDGQITQSFPVMVQPEDNTPPTAPVGIKGIVHGDGRVTLEWTANTEKDIYGYKIYRGNSLNEQFFLVSPDPVRKPSFKDSITLHTLTEEVYYKVVALDHHYNPSDYSAPVKLKRPDQIPPAAPVFKHTKVEGGKISLSWIPSVSEDVVKQELHRVDKNKRESRLLMTLSKDAKEFTDSYGIEGGETYTYELITFDDDGLITKAEVEVSFVSADLLQPMKELQAVVNREKRQVQLKWKNNQSYSSIQIYRKVDGGPMRLYKTIEGNKEEFTDQYLQINSSYQYKLRGVAGSGESTELSKEITVTY